MPFAVVDAGAALAVAIALAVAGVSCGFDERLEQPMAAAISTITTRFIRGS
jgi:hypothetical protein